MNLPLSFVKRHELNSNKDFDFLKKNKYIIIPLHSSKKWFLEFCKHDNQYKSFLNKEELNSKKIEIKYRVSDTLYDGTIFEGEFISESNTFYIHDIHKLKGDYVNLDYIYRLIVIEEILNNETIIDKNINSIHIQLKKYYQENYYKEILNQSYNHYLFKCIKAKKEFIYTAETPCEIETPCEMEKSCETQLFMVTKTEYIEVYELRSIVSEARYTAYIPTLELSKKMAKLFEKEEEELMECRYDEYHKKWTPMITI